MNVIVDSCIFISVYDKGDSNHQKAADDLKALVNKNDTIWITEHILDEITTIFVKRKYKKQLPLFIDRIYSGQIEVFLPKNRHEAEKIRFSVLQKAATQGKTKASFTDIYSMVVANEGFLSNCKVLSYDHHLKVKS